MCTGHHCRYISKSRPSSMVAYNSGKTIWMGKGVVTLPSWFCDVWLFGRIDYKAFSPGNDRSIAGGKIYCGDLICRRLLTPCTPLTERATSSACFFWSGLSTASVKATVPSKVSTEMAKPLKFGLLKIFAFTISLCYSKIVPSWLPCRVICVTVQKLAALFNCGPVQDPSCRDKSFWTRHPSDTGRRETGFAIDPESETRKLMGLYSEFDLGADFKNPFSGKIVIGDGPVRIAGHEEK